MADDDLVLRPGRQRSSGARGWRKANSLVGRVLQLSRRSGYTALSRSGSRSGTGHRGRGRGAALTVRRSRFDRRVVVKARVVRHRGARFRSAPLARHIAYLEREGVTREAERGQMFDARSDSADADRFAGRCAEDRHHFRFIVSPEDANEMADLRDFTRELMADMARDLDTALDWIAVDHWNTDNPHIHVLVRGVAADGEDLVIDRSYISEGMRARAEERATIELGPRSERAIEQGLRHEVDAERWTSLDRRLHRQCRETGVLDLRPGAMPAASDRARSERLLLVGRARVLERIGLAERVGPASWTLAPDLEATLRALGERGDIIKSMHRAMSGQRVEPDPARFAVHASSGEVRVLGRLIERGLHDELTGEAYAIVDATDGHTHYLRFPEIERTGDAPPGAIVETGHWTDRRGQRQTSLLVRSDLSLARQISARGATWLDRQLLSPQPQPLIGPFGEALRDALDRRAERLVGEGLASRAGRRLVFVSGLLDTLRARELAETGELLAARYGKPMLAAGIGDHVAGIYRERVTLASGRFAMIDNGMGFQLVPWRQDLDRRLGQEVLGRIDQRGTIEWRFARTRGPAL